MLATLIVSLGLHFKSRCTRGMRRMLGQVVSSSCSAELARRLPWTMYKGWHTI